jgi:hypothetical protein
MARSATWIVACTAVRGTRAIESRSTAAWPETSAIQANVPARRTIVRTSAGSVRCGWASVGALASAHSRTIRDSARARKAVARRSRGLAWRGPKSGELNASGETNRECGETGHPRTRGTSRRRTALAAQRTRLLPIAQARTASIIRPEATRR